MGTIMNVSKNLAIIIIFTLAWLETLQRVEGVQRSYKPQIDSRLKLQCVANMYLRCRIYISLYV